MQQKKSYNFGWRGWLLVIWVATGMLSYVVAGNYPLNIMADFYGGAQTLSMIYTGASIVGIIVQIIVSRKAGAIKSWKGVSVVLGIASIVFMILEMIIKPGVPWLIFYGLATALTALYGTWALSVLVGVWFPRRKGTVMGIVTFAFPIGNALIGPFASSFFGNFGARMGMLGPKIGEMIGELIGKGVNPDLAPQQAEMIVAGQAAQGAAFAALWPFVLVVLVGFIIGIIFISEFPEQVGAFRDNDRSFTPEMAQAMMKAEEENRKTTVWTTGHTFACPDFWLIVIPEGLLLFFAVGAMTQTNAMITPYEGVPGIISAVGGYNNVMLFIAAAGIIGSYVFGLIDTKKGTKFAVALSCIFMIVSGIFGFIDNGTTLFIGFMILGLFMGASSNYTVSSAVQYWRIEDFPSVFSAVNPVANLINAFGPMVVAALIAAGGTKSVFIGILVAGVVGTILALLFKPARVKAYDDKYRSAAGKPLDDVLVGRK